MQSNPKEDILLLLNEINRRSVLVTMTTLLARGMVNVIVRKSKNMSSGDNDNSSL